MITAAFVGLVALLSVTHGSAIVKPDTVTAELPDTNITLRKLEKPVSLTRGLTEYFITTKRVRHNCQRFETRL